MIEMVLLELRIGNFICKAKYLKPTNCNICVCVFLCNESLVVDCTLNVVITEELA